MHWVKKFLIFHFIFKTEQFEGIPLFHILHEIIEMLISFYNIEGRLFIVDHAINIGVRVDGGSQNFQQRRILWFFFRRVLHRFHENQLRWLLKLFILVAIYGIFLFGSVRYRNSLFILRVSLIHKNKFSVFHCGDGWCALSQQIVVNKLY